MASQSWLVAKQLALVTPVRCEVFAAKVLPKEYSCFIFLNGSRNFGSNLSIA